MINYKLLYYSLFLTLFPYLLLGELNSDQNLLFSHERGFYYEPFTLTISSQIQNSNILYTLNGDDPKEGSNNVFSSTSPVEITINPRITSSRDYAPGFIIRVCLVSADTAVTQTITHTYLFPDLINEMSRDNQQPSSGWLGLNDPHIINYGMDPEIYNNALYSDDFKDCFLSIPTLSLVTDLGSLFDSDSGIYVNSLEHGSEWERRTSLELLNSDESEDFQINCGVRIRGGWSRHYDNPKHAFRIFFRSVYGDSKLKYPFFGEEGADEFDKIDIRTSQNYSWSYKGDDRNTFMRDVFSRDVQKEMNQPYTRSKFYHLYINGTYWGLYQTQERSEASYAQYYFGGNREDYDVVKVDAGENFDRYHIEATDGTLDKWRDLWNAGELGFRSNTHYYKVQGLNPDQTINPQYEKLLDVENLIDYMIVTFFVGDFDGPISGFRGNASPNNFYAIINHSYPDGFKFFRHDSEHSLFFHDWGNNRTGPFPAGRYFKDSNPQWIHQRLMENSNYRLKFADRVYKHFFNDGALTLENNRERINKRKNEIFTAIVAESARWGDSKSTSPKTKLDWIREVAFITNDFLPTRNDIVLEQLIEKSLYPDIDPPTFNVESGQVLKGTRVMLSSPKGEIYYCTDGSDPYSSEPTLYSEPLEIMFTTTIKARVFYNNSWSAINEGKFIVGEDLSNLQITELHYHPIDNISGIDTISGKEFEFIELKNIGQEELNLSMCSFVNGIDFIFPENTKISADEFKVIASNTSMFKQRYGYEPDFEYEGQFNNGGEKIEVIQATGDTLFSFRYEDSPPWPIEADGNGYSLVSKKGNPNGDPGDPYYWIASGEIHGSPGSDDILSEIKIINNIQSSFSLNQNYPNPFNPSTLIIFSIPQSGHVSLKVFDILGSEITDLVDENKSPGTYSVKFDASNLSSGIYFYSLNVSGFSKVRKMLLLK